MSLNIGSNFFNSMLGMSSNQNSNTGLTGLLGDYNAIKNGSYLKLAKHYYATDGAKEATQKKFSNYKSNISGTQEEDKLTKASAEGAWKDVTALRSDKLYQTKEDGTYDSAAITNQVKQFVNSYNSVIESTQDSNHTGVLRSASRLVTQTGNYKDALSKIGITVQSDNTLKLDETAFAASDMKNVKDLFAGDFSFGSNTQSKMLQLISDAGSTLSGLYQANGTTASSTIGSLYDSLF